MNWVFSEMLPIHYSSFGIGVVATIIAAYLCRLAKAYLSGRDKWHARRKPENIAWCLLAELYELNAKFEEEPMQLIMAMILWREKVERMEPILMSKVGADFANEMALKTSADAPAKPS